MYSCFMISFDEPNADQNYKRLQQVLLPALVDRVHGVQGILNAHVEAARLSRTEYFWVVDGDNYVLRREPFRFRHTRRDGVIRTCVWRCRNPLNGLEYGYGGLKLLHRDTVLNSEMQVDMTTSLRDTVFVPMPDVASETRFNTDPMRTFRAAFRECTKLASQCILNQNPQETLERLERWCNTAEGDFASDALRGARQGRDFGKDNANDPKVLSLINDFEWINERYNECGEYGYDAYVR